jgi:DNA gyrase subunit A
MAIRFQESDVRPMGRNTSGVKGISLQRGDQLVGMVVADPRATLLTACEHGYGKRTPFGVGSLGTDESEEENATAARYRTQHRGGKGLRDIKTTKRNGRVIGIARVDEDDELLMMTARGKIQRIAISEISSIGRNTQGVRIMKLDEEDSLVAIVRVPRGDNGDTLLAEPPGDLADAPKHQEPADSPLADVAHAESGTQDDEPGMEDDEPGAQDDELGAENDEPGMQDGDSQSPQV